MRCYYELITVYYTLNILMCKLLVVYLQLCYVVTDHPFDVFFSCSECLLIALLQKDEQMR